MTPTPAIDMLGPAGWLLLVAFVAGGMVRLLKANKLNLMLRVFSIPAIPKKALPWLSIALGFVISGVEARVGGLSWSDSALKGCWGVFSGTLAIGGNEALPAVARLVIGAKLTAVLFGKDAGAGEPAKAKATATAVPPLPILLALLSAFLALPTLGGCAAVMSALPTVVSAVTDGMMILDSIERFTDVYFAKKPDLAKQEIVGKAIAKARAALQLANRAAAGTDKLGRSEHDAAFADFRIAYEELLALVGPLGVRPAGTLSACAGTDCPPTLEVPEPLALQ